LRASASLKGFTPLHAAAFFGHKEIVELLLKHGSNLNESAASLTALDFAKAMNHQEIVDLLENYSLENTTSKMKI